MGAAKETLRNKNLACWCRVDGKPCHTDVLLKLTNRKVGEGQACRS